MKIIIIQQFRYVILSSHFQCVWISCVFFNENIRIRLRHSMGENCFELSQTRTYTHMCNIIQILTRWQWKVYVCACMLETFWKKRIKKKQYEGPKTFKFDYQVVCSTWRRRQQYRCCCKYRIWYVVYTVL